MTFDAMIAGHVCLDIIPEVPPVDFRQALVPGALFEIGPAQFATGGVPSNTGRTMVRLGISPCLIGKVGADLFGQVILDLFREDDPHLADHMRVVPGEATSYTIVVSPPGSDRFFMHCAGANHTFGAEDIPYDLLLNARLFHFGYPPYMRRMYAHDGAELVQMFRRAKEKGVLTSLDMALPDPKGASGQVNWRCILEHTLPYVDVFLPSLDELLFMLPRTGSSPDVLMSELAGDVLSMMHNGIIVIKLGARGIYLRAGATVLETWQHRELWVPAFRPNRLVGTTGAGDAAIGGLLAAILRGYSSEDALTFAAAVGACNVEAADALSGIRGWEATRQRIDAGWSHLPLQPNAPGWVWDEAHQLWVGPHNH